MHRGFIPLYRKIQDHPFYKEKRVFSKYEAWLDLVMEARHKKEPEKIIIGMKTIECGYGQSIKSLRTWAARWGWTAKRVSRFFNLLKKMDQIRHENVTVTTRITILNYDKYCLTGHAGVTDMSHNGNTSETRRKHDRLTDNNVNNVNNVKKKYKSGKFVNPTLEDVKAYCIERKNNVDPESFINFYESKGWMVGKNKMKDWKAAIRTWEKNNSKFNQNNGKAKGCMKRDGFTSDYYGKSSTDGKENPYF